MSASAERAYAHIKTAILNGRYRSGTRVTEDMVASELGMSRTPIRDALRRLQVEQLIMVTPYSGARVASWSPTELGEIAQMRVMLESFAAELAATKRTKDHLDRMAALCTQMETAAEAAVPDLDLISASNVSLHRVIVEAADNARLGASLEPLWNVPLVVRKYGLFGKERLARSLSHHREILTAISTGDSEWAGAVMRVHILAARSFDAALAGLDTEQEPHLVRPGLEEFGTGTDGASRKAAG